MMEIIMITSDGFDAYEKTKLDLLTFKNTKYLLYRFADYIAVEEIQNQNWQYFFERVIEVCK